MTFSYNELNEALERYSEYRDEKKAESNKQDITDKNSRSGSADGYNSNDDASKYTIDKDAGKEKEDETALEIGYFHLINCDIKASEDQIRQMYMERSQELIM